MSITTGILQKSGLSFRCKFASTLKAPLIILIHGKSGNVNVMWAFERVLPQQDVHIVSFEAPHSDPDGGKSWWFADDSLVDAAMVAAQLVEAGTAEFIAQADIEPTNKTYVGFSQGAALISTMLQRGFDVSRAALLAGFVVEIPEPQPLTNRIFMFHGRHDQIVSLERAQRGRIYLERLGAVITWFEEDVAHKLGIEGMKQLRSWIAR